MSVAEGLKNHVNGADFPRRAVYICDTERESQPKSSTSQSIQETVKK